jgi:hypothetical protein
VRPAVLASVMASFPMIDLRHPRAHDIVDDPIEVAGVGTGFEGTLQVRVRGHDGKELTQTHVQAGGSGIWGNFFLRLDVPGVPRNPHGTLEVFEISAKDGREINKVVRRIVFGRSLRNPYTGFAVHEVERGETLSGIAEQWYEDATKFRIVFEANRHLLNDPDVIVPGQLLRIPQ